MQEHMFDNSSTDSDSSSLTWWLSTQGVETLNNCSIFIFAKSQYLSTHFFASPSIFGAPSGNLGVSYSRTRQLLNSSCGCQRSEHFFGTRRRALCSAYFHVECFPSLLDAGIVFVFPNQLVSSIFSTVVQKYVCCPCRTPTPPAMRSHLEKDNTGPSVRNFYMWYECLQKCMYIPPDVDFECLR